MRGGIIVKHFNKPLFLATVFLLSSFTVLSIFFISNLQMIYNKQKDVLLRDLEISEHDIKSDFEEIEQVLLTLESHIKISYDTEDFLLFIQQIDQNSETMASIYLGKPDKTMINSSGFVPGPGFDLTTRSWYQMAIASDNIIFTPAFINATNDRVIVTAAKAVYSLNEELIGVIAADIDIRTITTIVAEKKIGENGFVFLIDKNGNLLAYPGLEQDTISLAPVGEIEPDLSNLPDSGLSLNFTINNQKGVMAYNVIDNIEYVIGVFMPRSEFSSSFIILSFIFSSLVIVLLIVSFVLLIIYEKRVKKPLTQLITDIESINLTEDSNPQIPEPIKDDYLNIRKSINKINDKTNRYLNERLVAEHQLLIENQRVKLLMESAADIIFEIDLEKRYVSIFGRGLDLIGKKPQDFIGKTVEEIFGEFAELRKNAYEKALNGSQIIYDWTYLNDESTLYFETSISPIYDENKNVIGAVGISRDITEPMQKQKEIEYINIHDFLTGLFNRRYFVEAFARADNDLNYPLGMMMIDLNGLKIFNDAYGHNTGDLALIEVAKVLKSVSKESDIVCRIGGDEFAIIMNNTTLTEIDTIKDLIKNKLSEILIENIPISVAIGYEIKADLETNLEKMIKNAENHMYRNKVTEGKSVRNSAIKAILKTLTDKFDEEKTHSNRVCELCRKMGDALNLKSDDLRELEVAGLFHDIGKISIPDEILHKPSKLTKEEFDVIKTHTENGYHILRAADEYSNLAEYALSHHEHWNGQGYPRGLEGTNIPLFSRIICIVDAFEAMTSDRVYRKKMDELAAVNEIIKYSGTQFDPNLAQIFVEKVLGYQSTKN